jgi:antitoxin VapB
VTQSILVTVDKCQTIRLPKSMAFPRSASKVDIVKIGHARLITSTEALWDDFIDSQPISEDFMVEPRTQHGKDF